MKNLLNMKKVFAPLRGWYLIVYFACNYISVFAPLRGSWRAAPERVLRGEVEIWYKDFDGMAKKFLPPYGDGTPRRSADDSVI